MSLIFIISTAVIVCGCIAFYLGKRWKLWLNLNISGRGNIVYWAVVIFAVFLLFISRALRIVSTHWLPLIGDIVFGFIICALYILIIFDFLRWISKKRFKVNKFTTIAYVVCSFSLFAVGYYMAKSPQIIYYQVKIDKPANVEHLRIVQATDIHISESTSPDFIQQMVNKINNLNADLIVITGDTIDRRLTPFVEQHFDKQFEQLKSKYGTYIILGNHEYLGLKEEGYDIDKVVDTYKSAQLKVLKDDVIYNDQLGITLIGRDDFSSSLYGVPRASLSDLVMFTDSTTPIILLDHQPKDLDEPANLNVDLMISGHTHGGQVLPITFIVDMMYKNANGLYQDLAHHFTSIVSSGYGFWGPPIRLMTRSEIVVIDVTFNKKEDLLLDLSE